MQGSLRFPNGCSLRDAQRLCISSALMHELYSRRGYELGWAKAVACDGAAAVLSLAIVLRNRLAPRDVAALACASKALRVVVAALGPALPVGLGSVAAPPPKRDARLREGLLCHVRQQVAELQRGLLAALPTIDKAAARELRKALCASTSTGVMPSFACGAGALSGYIQDNLKPRVLNTALILAHEHLAASVVQCFLNHRDQKGGGGELRVADIGGGPGFSAVAVHALARFCVSEGGASGDDGDQERIDGLGSWAPLRVEACSFDCEPSWAESTATLDALLNSPGTGGGGRSGEVVQTRLRFRACDLLEPLSDTDAAWLGGCDVLFFSFVLVENAMALRQRQWEPIRTLFSLPPPPPSESVSDCFSAGAQKSGCVLFIFTDSTHRLWAELVLVALQSCADFELSLPMAAQRRFAVVLYKKPRREPAGVLECNGSGMEVQQEAVQQAAGQQEEALAAHLQALRDFAGVHGVGQQCTQRAHQSKKTEARHEHQSIEGFLAACEQQCKEHESQKGAPIAAHPMAELRKAAPLLRGLCDRHCWLLALFAAHADAHKHNTAGGLDSYDGF